MYNRGVLNCRKQRLLVNARSVWSASIVIVVILVIVVTKPLPKVTLHFARVLVSQCSLTLHALRVDLFLFANIGIIIVRCDEISHAADLFIFVFVFGVIFFGFDIEKGVYGLFALLFSRTACTWRILLRFLAVVIIVLLLLIVF